MGRPSPLLFGALAAAALAAAVLTTPPPRSPVPPAPPAAAPVARGPDVEAEVCVLSGMGDLDADILKRSFMAGWESLRFAGLDALESAEGWGPSSYLVIYVPYRRRMLQIDLTLDDAKDRNEALATLERLLAPTLAPVPAENR